MTNQHKHCVYCGESSAHSIETRTGCTAEKNHLRPDTVGNKPHAYLAPEWPPSTVHVYKPDPPPAVQFKMTFEKAVAIATQLVDELLADLEERIPAVAADLCVHGVPFGCDEPFIDPVIRKQWREWWIHLVVQSLIDAGEATKDDDLKRRGVESQMGVVTLPELTCPYVREALSMCWTCACTPCKCERSIEW
jgi:hypothetical protein